MSSNALAEIAIAEAVKMSERASTLLNEASDTLGRAQPSTPSEIEDVRGAIEKAGKLNAAATALNNFCDDYLSDSGVINAARELGGGK